MLALSSAAAANDAAYYGDGATVFATEEGRVRMEREVVQIRYDEKSRQYLADCRFTFINGSIDTVQVQMGFPDWREHSEDGADWAIRDFKVWVGGKPVKTTHKEVAKEEYPGAYTWPVTFAPGQRIEVRNTYRFGGLVTMGPPDACLHGLPEAEKGKVWWLKAADKEGGWAFSNSTCRRVSYIVTTGKSWGGPIGLADIRIELPPDVLPHLVQAIPAATSIHGRTVRWQFQSFTPDQDLHVVILGPIPPESDTYGPHDLPLLETPDQVRAWGEVALASGTHPSVVDGLLKKYGRKKQYADVVAALRELKEKLRKR